MLKKIIRHKKLAVFSVLSVFALVSAFGTLVRTAEAAQVTSLRAIFKRIKASTASDGITMYFVTPTGIQTGGGDTITLTFSADFTLAAESATNFDLGLGDSGTCTTASYTDETIVTTGASATEWNVDVTGQVITFSPETDDVLTAGYCIKIEMGTDATTGGTGSSSTVTNGAADDDDTIAIAGSIGDTGTLAVDIITDDQVSITATVNSSISFAISDTTVGFGPLSLSSGRWATGDTNGTDATNGTTEPTTAHTLSIATNAQSGYSVTYNGALLTSGGNNIDAASITDDSDGAPGSTEAFGITLKSDGDATIPSAYQRDATASFAFTAGTPTQIASETGPTATETLSVSYLANITGLTAAGSYSTTLTFSATGTY